ncbi:MAG: DUF362 domain-containing protein [Pseudomonadota bacterium]|uniref:DUF362 domain-containing protein n=1 Tax=Candidatus Desulfatibia profunda TaxID=2841695 RepID=A0A8J6NX54_9BACT|nr:DUF362 domain-containing protein [Candidatus Desulfatibia profunda]MBL7179478.1 DUF362 domain-containing protein [Desulfobacterales bacterium]
MARSVVSALRTKPETVLADISRLMELAGVKSALDLDVATILKDNISWHFPFLSANTTPWQLEGTIQGLQAAGFKDLVAVHNNTVVTDPFKGGRLNKLEPVYQRYSIPEKYNFLPQDMTWEVYRPKGRMRVLHRIYPEGIRIPTFFIGKNIVHLPTVKCHIYTTTTGSMKNAFGGLLNTRRHYTHTVIHETLVDLLVIQKEIHRGIFTVMDGTLCGNGAGPRTMIPVQKDLILASADPVAIDAVSAKLMGFDPMKIEYIRLAHEDGLGVGRPEEIEIRGEDLSSFNFGFRVGDNLASLIGDLLWFGPLKGIQNLFFRTPLVYVFVLGSSFYHDRIWWPFVGQRIMEVIRANTPWGKLFSEY